MRIKDASVREISESRHLLDLLPSWIKSIFAHHQGHSRKIDMGNLGQSFIDSVDFFLGTEHVDVSNG